MRALALASLLALLRAAQATCPEEQRVEISGTAGERHSYTDDRLGNYLRTIYGETIDVFCSGPDSANLFISMDGARKHAELINTTTIQLTEKKFVIERYVYRCEDLNTTCAASLTVIVVPASSVVSPNAKHKLTDGLTYFFVPITEDYQIVCSGNRASFLYIISDEGESIETEVVNETTVKSIKLRELEHVYKEYKCQFHISSKIAIMSTARVYVDHFPAVTQVLFVEDDSQIGGWWDVLSLETTVTVFHMDDGNSVRLCDEEKIEDLRFCTWSVGDVWKNDLSLRLQVCNVVICANQTFDINRTSIIRPPSPVGLKVLRTSSRGAVITWPDDLSYGIPLEYLVFYQMPEIDPQEVNASTSVKCKPDETLNSECRIVLELPCPAAFYVINVYRKLTITPTDNAYWSDPAIVNVYTDSPGSREVVDPICSKEAELIDNAVVAAYEVRKLARNFRKDVLALLEKVKALKQKLAEVNKASRAGLVEH